MLRDSATSFNNQVSQSTFIENCDNISEANPQIFTKVGIYEEYTDKKNKLFEQNNHILGALDFNKTTTNY